MADSDYGAIGPGTGAILGKAIAEGDAQAARHASELEEMRVELRKRRKLGLYDEAFAQAAADIAKEMVGELGGKGGARRLSDPGNVDGRNAAFADSAAEHVRRLSDNSVTWTPEQVANIKRQRALK